MITFPTTPEASIAYQEQLAGRELTEREQEATAAWVETFNLSYEGGLRKDYAMLEDSLAEMDKLITREENGPKAQRVLKACCWWIIIAWKQGFRDAKEGGEAHKSELCETLTEHDARARA